MIFKYIIFKDSLKVILFSINSFTHKEAANTHEKIKSAGFCSITYSNSELKIICYGKSETLGINSEPKEDEKIIKKTLLT